MGLFDKLKEGLSKTRAGFVEKVTQVFTGKKKIDEDMLEELEEILIQGDVGVNTSVNLVEKLRERVEDEGLEEGQQLQEVLIEEVTAILKQKPPGLRFSSQKPTVILVVGVNGVGKTTSIGKLANFFKSMGLKPILAAGDTFRAAAIEQLEIWGQRVGIDVIKHQQGSDPAAVVFDSIQAAKSRKADILIIDTAGRLQNKANLMEELRKIRKVIEREIPGAPHEVLLVLDATTGQNALSQAKLFKEIAGVTGVVLTKLDGTAKGGVVLGIYSEQGLPVKFIGVGEKIDDLRPFAAQEFVEALFK